MNLRIERPTAAIGNACAAIALLARWTRAMSNISADNPCGP
jgi:hypothetical protein